MYGSDKTEEKMVIELSKAEVLRIIDDFEYGSFGDESTQNNREHPEGSVAEQKNFLDLLQCLLDLVESKLIVNPYGETEN